MSAIFWIVGATHEAFGDEGLQEYRGTRLGARRRAARIARAAGHGWRPVVRLLGEVQFDVAEVQS